MSKSASSDKYVVAIGASAGGLEAFTAFFEHAEANDSIAYILIQHLSPDYKSLLVDLIGKHTALTVVQAEDRMTIQGDHVYVIPPKMNMTVDKGRLRLTGKDGDDKGPNVSIDTFLYSFATAYGEKAIAVILSGTGSDGSRGIESVKDEGGFVIVQEPASAKFDGMPKSSIDTGRVDMVVPVDRIYSEILGYIGREASSSLEEQLSEETLQRILDLVESSTGCDFKSYKRPTILRRLGRRLSSLQIERPEEYYNYLKANKDECQFFCRDLLIGVTSFFRDPAAFQSLKENALIPMIESKGPGETLKLWITACSTGEEAYTIAMMVSELLQAMGRKLDVKIFATDLNPTHIDKAVKGKYSIESAAAIPKEYREKYFTARDDSIQVIPSLRKLIVFSRHNLSSDPPFIKSDLICCRNMLIYVNTQLQRKIFSKFIFALNAGGFLFLGSSESIPANKEHFTEVDRKWKIYCRSETSVKPPYSEILGTTRPPVARQAAGNVLSAQGKSGLSRQAQAMLLQDFDIVAFYIDNDFIIHEGFGNSGNYLQMAGDKFERDLIKLLPQNIAIPLNTAILRAWNRKEAQLVKGIVHRVKEVLYHIVLSVRPPDESSAFTLVSINSVAVDILKDLSPGTGQEDAGTDFSALQMELKESKFNLQTAIEELETTNEELQSANEELLSANEELQSSNEELQSLNEELHTLNAEHQQQIRELVELNDDLNNYFRGSDIGQIILDKQMKIRKFNPAAAQLVNLIDKDIDRLISNLTTNFVYEGFENDIRQVLMSNVVLEREVFVDEKRCFLVRISSYISQQKIIEGALLSFINITAYKELYNIIDGVFKASEAAILVLRSDARQGRNGFICYSGNEAAARLFENTLHEKEHSLADLDPQLNGLLQQDLTETMGSGTSFRLEAEIRQKWFQVVGVKINNGVALTLTDISDRKRSEMKLRQNYIDIYAAREKLKTLNHSLEDLVEQRTRELSVSEERFRKVSQVTNDAVVDWNFADNSFWVSDNFKRLFGYEPGEVSNNRASWLENIHPMDKDRVTASINAALQNNGHNWTQEYRFRHSNGSYRFISDRGYFMLDESGTPYRMLSSMLDVTELKDAEQRLKQSEIRLGMALDVPGVAGWDLDIATNRLVYSKNLPLIFGHSESVAFKRDDFRKQIHPEDMGVLNKQFEISGDTGQYGYEARVIWPDGSTHWISTLGKVIYNEVGKPERMVGILKEITSEKSISLKLEQEVEKRTQQLKLKNSELMEAYENLKTLNAQLAKSNGDLEQFAYIASHDLQEPLRKIQTFISVIRQNEPGTDTDFYIGKITDSAARMSALIRNVLQYSRLLRADSAFAEVDLDSIIHQLTVDFELLIKEKEAQIRFGSLPVVHGIPHQLSQLFYNLISNALKFSGQGAIVDINSRELQPEEYAGLPELDPSKKYLRISVKDHGIGFDQKYAEKIFSFFYRLGNSPAYAGSGIGLAICRKIVQNHSGIIFASSEKEKGSEFVVVLPAAQKTMDALS